MSGVIRETFRSCSFSFQSLEDSRNGLWNKLKDVSDDNKRDNIKSPHQVTHTLQPVCDDPTLGGPVGSFQFGVKVQEFTVVNQVSVTVGVDRSNLVSVSSHPTPQRTYGGETGRVIRLED